jgi:hypothetical protein
MPNIYIVNSQEILSTILQDSQNNIPVIDFDKYTFIRLNVDWSTEGNVTCSFIQTAENVYTVEAEVTGLPAINRDPYTPYSIPTFTHFLVPKLSKEAMFELNVTRNMNLEGWRVIKHVIDAPASVMQYCLDVFGITDSFLVSISGIGAVFAYNIPDEFRQNGLSVLVSGKRYYWSGLNRCSLYPSQHGKPEPESTFITMFHLDSIKLNTIEQ